MTFEEKVSSDEIFCFIKKFYKSFKDVPSVGFMAGQYKVTPKTIHVKLGELHNNGLIRRIKKVKNIVTYEII